MKHTIAMLLVGCWIAPPVGAEIITMDTTIDSPHALGRVLIFDGPQGPTTVDVVDGAVIPNSIEVYGHSVLNIRGGVTNSFVEGYDNSTVNIFDGLVATGEDVNMFHDSVANIYGGHFGDDIRASDSATVNLYGGTFEKDGGGAMLSVQGDGVMNVHLREFEIMHPDPPANFDRLVGILLDGSEIDVTIWVDPVELRDARIVFHAIPEPDSSTLAFMMAIVLGFRVLTRRNQGVRRTGVTVEVTFRSETLTAGTDAGVPIFAYVTDDKANAFTLLVNGASKTLASGTDVTDALAGAVRAGYALAA